jgi:hypothetical protein
MLGLGLVDDGTCAGSADWFGGLASVVVGTVRQPNRPSSVLNTSNSPGFSPARCAPRWALNFLS